MFCYLTFASRKFRLLARSTLTIIVCNETRLRDSSWRAREMRKDERQVAADQNLRPARARALALDSPCLVVFDRAPTFARARASEQAAALPPRRARKFTSSSALCVLRCVASSPSRRRHRRRRRRRRDDRR